MNQSALPDATGSTRGVMPGADKAKLDALPVNATLEARFSAIESGYPAADAVLAAAITSLTTAAVPDSADRRYITDAQQTALHPAVTLGAVGAVPAAAGASLAAQVLTLQPADASNPGVVTSGDQSFGGIKTLVAVVTSLVRAVAASLVLRSSLGSVSGDRCVVIGTSETDGNTHTLAKIASLGTGVGGTYVEKAFLLKSGWTLDCSNTVNTYGMSLNNCGAGTTGYSLALSSGGSSVWGGQGGYGSLGLTNTHRSMHFIANAITYDPVTAQAFYFRSQIGAAKVVLRVDATAGLTANYFECGPSATPVLAIDKDGAIQLNIAGGTRPTAAASQRGKLWYSKGAGGVADTIEICLKDAADAYAWVQLAP